MAKNFKGVIIEESLEDKSVLKKVKIIKTEVEKVTEEHQTPWLEKWTMRTVEIPENQAEDIANELSKALESEHEWYADFKNSKIHYIIFHNKIFLVDRSKKEEYNAVTKYGISIGIPAYQVDFSGDII